MVVVPKEAQLNPENNVALLFFKLTFGSLSKDDTQPLRILSAFMAISSFGNIVVMTFTAARGRATTRLGDEFRLTVCSKTRNCQRRNLTFSEVLRPNQKPFFRTSFKLDSVR